MTAIRYCYLVIIITTVLILLMGAVNYYVNLYALFGDAGGKSVSIYSDERTSKYLLAHNYVPSNFEGYIVGPSLSANLDPKPVSDYKIYNLSMMGANITEQKTVLEKALEKSNPKFVILCLHPYLTMDHGMKTGMINSKEYYGALGSISLYKAYATKFVRDHNLMPSKFPQNQFNEYGFNHYGNLLQKMPVEVKIAEQIKDDRAMNTTIDKVAWKEFMELIEELNERDIKVVAYFHPLPYPIFDRFRTRLDVYQNTTRNALNGKAILIDFNTASYDFFTKDLTNYIDHGHLSDKGQHYLLKEIIKKSGLSR